MLRFRGHTDNRLSTSQECDKVLHQEQRTATITDFSVAVFVGCSKHGTQKKMNDLSPILSEEKRTFCRDQTRKHDEQKRPPDCQCVHKRLLVAKQFWKPKRLIVDTTDLTFMKNLSFHENSSPLAPNETRSTMDKCAAMTQKCTACTLRNADNELSNCQCDAATDSCLFGC